MSRWEDRAPLRTLGCSLAPICLCLCFPCAHYVLSCLLSLALTSVCTAVTGSLCLPPCPQDPDISLRRRALELLFSLVNESNVQPLVAELLAYLRVTDAEFKRDLTATLCALLER